MASEFRDGVGRSEAYVSPVVDFVAMGALTLLAAASVSVFVL